MNYVSIGEIARQVYRTSTIDKLLANVWPNPRLFDARGLADYQPTQPTMPPKGGFKKKTGSDGTSTPVTPSLAVQLSYLHQPRPFKNPHYTKNVNRRAKNLKTVLGQERERERADREARRLKREELLRENPQAVVDIPEEVPTYTTIEAPPSVIPHKHLCDITGLEAPYTDPATGLRYHDKSVYEIVKGLNPSMAKDYLSARGVNSIVK